MKVSFFSRKKVAIEPLKCYNMHQRASKVQNLGGPEPPAVALQNLGDHDRNNPQF